MSRDEVKELTGAMLKQGTGMDMLNPSIRGALRDLDAGLRALYGEQLMHVVLFGSQARGDADEGSDIDVLVVLHGSVNAWEEIERTGRIVSDLSLKYAVVISCVFVGVDRYVSEESPLLLNARLEGVLL